MTKENQEKGPPMQRLFVDFIPVVIWALLVCALIIVMLLASWVLRPHVLQSSATTSTYECGEEPVGPARISYPYNYVVYTVMFVIVDVLGAFLYLISASSLRLEPLIVWQTLLLIAIVMGSVGYGLKMMPMTTPDGHETLLLYRQAKAEQIAKKEGHGGGH